MGDPLEFVDASQRVLDGIKNADFLGKARGREGGRAGGMDGESGSDWGRGENVFDRPRRAAGAGSEGVSVVLLMYGGAGRLG